MTDAIEDELRDVLASLRAEIERQRDCGAAWLPIVSSVAAGAPPPATAPPAVARMSQDAPRPLPAAPPARGEELFADPGLGAARSLEALQAVLGDCRRCKLSGLGRTNIVFGVGNPDADLMFVGEGPGYDEDLQAEPFVGKAGQLLTEIITKGMKLARADVYIANIVKCRPPGNRNPEPDEVATCLPFLRKQIELVQPRCIIALGAVAVHSLLGVKTPISRLRGVWQDFRGIKVMPTFHPAYLLRTPGDKRLVWADVKVVMAELGLPV